ncbi:Osmotically-inducible protein Y precursor [Maioricimonas rarisocia]|uniref:Osmotically-inducible protein Y n=1 Tax=Maioricimonas rarisocia TaxID=2528026 RepID=A0A517Z2C6_9PLAN|nr:BON domain-containing protein [Maioricimonas rarisocia]QDU36626.1 Osmotically-inducible protein Y precursor [Maioricimonas rarisocia]
MRSMISMATSLGLMVVLGVSQAALAEPEMTDESIADHVSEEFRFDPAVPASQIDVGSEEGIITLSGAVDNLLARERAARIASTVRGVQSVINRIEVDPPLTRRGDEIEQDIESALLMAPATESYEVHASVSGGVVTLEGRVDSWQEKQLVERVVKGVAGVRGLQNNIIVEYAAMRPDEEIRRDIESALQWNVHIDVPTAIHVDVNDGEVTLSGTIGSASERIDAVKLAWVNGVRSVKAEELLVRNWAQDPEQRHVARPSMTDPEIEQAVRTALHKDPRIASADVEVDSEYGKVTLRGAVDSLQARRAAGQTVQNTVGVKDVSNQLEIHRSDDLPDEPVAQQVREALLRNAYTESHEVTVSVSDGVARLTGTVDTWFEKAQADDAAAGVRGVHRVRNELNVRRNDSPHTYDPAVDEYDPYVYDWYGDQPARSTLKSDEEIRESIESELWWSPFVDADQVTVTVENGKATLTGKVDSLSEKQSASENAIEGGALSISNELVVQY